MKFWKDEMLQWDPADYGNTSRMILGGDLIWLPEIIVFNSIDSAADLALSTGPSFR